MAEVACYGPREDTDGVRRPPLEGGGGSMVHPISVLELTKNEGDGGESSLAVGWSKSVEVASGVVGFNRPAHFVFYAGLTIAMWHRNVRTSA